MRHAVETLDELGVPNESQDSFRPSHARRRPPILRATQRSRGLRVIIAGAGGAAHLAGVIAAHTWLPVLGVPIQSQALQGLDSLLSIAQMPGGVPVGTLAIGASGAKNAGAARGQHSRDSDDKVRQETGSVSEKANRSGARSANAKVKTENVVAFYDRRRRSRTAATGRAVNASACRAKSSRLPTETVYGLAADALNPIAVAKIFEAKDRPRFDPLIVHLPDPRLAEKIVDLPANDRQLILKAGREKFWPGPFTMVLAEEGNCSRNCDGGFGHGRSSNERASGFCRNRARIWKTARRPKRKSLWSNQPDHRATCSGRTWRSNSTGCRCRTNRTWNRIDDRRYSRLAKSTSCAAVRSAQSNCPRFGKIDIAAPAEKVFAPGQLPSHYAPKTPLRLVEDFDSFLPKPNQHCALLAWNRN